LPFGTDTTAGILIGVEGAPFDGVVMIAALRGSLRAWAFLRQMGIPKASPDARDADAILAGQAPLAGEPGDTVTARLQRAASGD